MEPITQAFLDDMKALQEIQLELSEVDNLDTLHYRMIQLSHQYLGMERIALFLLDKAEEWLIGTYGTDRTGQIRDEHAYREAIPPNHWTCAVLNANNHLQIWSDTALYDVGEVVGTGWKGASALWNGQRALGYLVCDNLMTGKPLRPYEGELISILGSTFGHLIERKHGEIALRRSEAQLAEAQRIAQLGSWHWDMATNTITWSDELFRIFGISKADFQGKYDEYLTFLHPSDREYVRKVTQDAYQKRQSYSIYHSIITPQRGERIIHAKGRVITDNDGAVLYMVGTAQDITESKYTEDALTIRNQYLTALHQITLDLLNRRDMDDLLRALVNAATTILDAPYGEIMLKDNDELVVRAFTDNQPFLVGDRGKRGEALLSWEAHDTLRPVIIEDYCEWGGQRKIYHPLQLRAVANFPITIGDACIGVLGLSRSKQHYPFTEEQIHIGTMLSQLAAVVVDNATQYQAALQEITERKKTERRLQTLAQELVAKSQIEIEQRILAETLSDTAAVLNSTFNLDEIFRLILENIQRIIPHDSSNIMLIEDNIARIVQYNGWSQEKIDLLQGVEFPIHEIAYFHLMYQTQQSCIINDVKNLDAWFYSLADYDPLSYLAAPICIGNDVVGFVNLDSMLPNHFTPNHARRLQAFISHAAIALKNARLYNQSQALAALEERQRLARDLHDSVTQTLFAASVTSNAIYKKWTQDSTSIGEDLLELRDLTQGALAEMRTMLLELRPNALLEANIADLLRQLLETVKGRARLNAQFEVQGRCVLPPVVQVALFRIAQEAINNVIKHARAEHLIMQLQCEDDKVTLTIQDDGRGFDISQRTQSRFGLNIMDERAEEAGIILEISTKLGHGTTLKAIWWSKATS